MLQLSGVAVHLPQGYLFKDVDLQIKSKDRIALTGKNGAGKSTLFGIVNGDRTDYEGTVVGRDSTTTGLLSQHLEAMGSGKVFDVALSVDKHAYQVLNDYDRMAVLLETEATEENLERFNDLQLEMDRLQLHAKKAALGKILQGLGFDDIFTEYSELSGGWKMRALLGGLLVQAPDILLLDEPTNHLDIIAIQWLESFLSEYEGAVMVISHDRAFLDNCTNTTWDIANGKVTRYPFSYTKFEEQKAIEVEQLKRDQANQQKRIKETEQLIEKFRAKASKAAFAQTLIKKLEKEEIIQVEERDLASINVRFPLSVIPGKLVMELHDLSKSFEKPVLKGINKNIARGEKIALLGKNGSGKTTLLNCIAGGMDHEGEVKLGHNVQVAYFTQDAADKLDPNQTVLEVIDKVAVGEQRARMRDLLGAFLFSGESVDKKVSVLSGGERTRLALCRLLFSPSNFLILDEPTNHLDIQSKETLKNALKNYEGTFIVVSHDRDFLRGLSKTIWEIQDGHLSEIHGTVDEYLQKKNMDQLSEQDRPKPKQESTASPEDQKQWKKELHQLSKRNRNLEKEIEKLENTLDEIMVDMTECAPDDAEKLTELTDSSSRNRRQLDMKMAEWESVNMQMEELKAHLGQDA